MSEFGVVGNWDRLHHPADGTLESPVLHLPVPNEPETPNTLTHWGLARRLPQVAAQPPAALPDFLLMMPLGREHCALPALKTSPIQVGGNLHKLQI